MKRVDTGSLLEIAAVEFADIVDEAYSPDLNELRIILKDGSFIDAWFSLKLKGRYSYHWDRMTVDGKIYRHDNAPHKQWQSVSTFPKHFHNGGEGQVIASNISGDPGEALRQFLQFARQKLGYHGSRVR